MTVWNVYACQIPGVGSSSSKLLGRYHHVRRLTLCPCLSRRPLVSGLQWRSTVQRDYFCSEPSAWPVWYQPMPPATCSVRAGCDKRPEDLVRHLNALRVLVPLPAHRLETLLPLQPFQPTRSAHGGMSGRFSRPNRAFRGTSTLDPTPPVCMMLFPLPMQA